MTSEGLLAHPPGSAACGCPGDTSGAGTEHESLADGTDRADHRHTTLPGRLGHPVHLAAVELGGEKARPGWAPPSRRSGHHG